MASDDRALGQIASAGCSGNDGGDRSIDRVITVQQAKRVDDHPGVQVVVHGKRVAEDGAGIEG